MNPGVKLFFSFLFIFLPYAFILVFIYSLILVLVLVSKNLSGTDLQVSGILELEKALCEFFSNTAVLEARRAAARQAFHASASGIIENIWNILHFHVFRKALS
mgnify:CR=1 FL=1